MDGLAVRPVRHGTTGGKKMEASQEMPKYECHKKVWALKIDAIEFEANSAEDGTAIIRPADDGYAPFVVSREYMDKHKPEVGGYYVVYALIPGETESYKSYSPAEAFESGYSLIDG